MANIQENTKYNDTNKQPSFANLSGIMKGLQSKTQQTSSDTIKKAITSHFNPEVASSIFTAGKKVNTETNDSIFPLNQPIGQQIEGAKTEPIPGYEKFVAPDQYGNWVSPSEQATLRNWPTSLGGGQYVIDPTQTGKLIKSERVLWDNKLNPGGKKAALGNLSSDFYQIDHIVPLWVGGADTAANSEILDIPTHNKKTAIQSVPLTLLANGKIDLRQAKTMALTWKDKDSSGLPDPDNKGYVPLKVAEKYAKKWEEEVGKVHTMKYFGESFKESMANFGKGWLPTPIREFAKGLVGGGTAGIVPATGASKESGTIGTISNIAGNIAGTITGLGLLSKGIGATIRGAKSLLGAKKAISLADETAKAVGLTTDIGNLTQKAVSAKKRAETLTRMASTAGLLSLWGQIGLSGSEAINKDIEFEFKNHLKQFFTDVAFGGLLGSAGQNIKGYARVGLGTAALSLMEGESIQDSLQNAGLMTALHGMGYKRGMLDPKIRIGGEEAYKMSTVTINKYLGDVIPTVKKGQGVPEILKLDIPKLDNMRIQYQQKYPNDQRFKNVGPITNEAEAISFIEKASRKELGNLIAKSDGTIPQEDIKKEMTRIVTAKNQLYNQTLPITERPKKEWADLLSIGEKLRPGIKTEQTRQAANVNDNLKKIPVEIPNQTYDNQRGLVFPIGKSGVTGYGEKLDIIAKENINDFAKNPDNYDGKIYIPKTDMETAAIQRGVNYDYLANGKEAPTKVPEHTLRVFVRTNEGEFKPVGYMPQEASFNAKKYDLNQTYREQINRFRHTIDTAKTPEQVMELFNKDKAGIKIDKKTADTIFEKKNSLTDEELYSLLKPVDIYYKLDSKLNNSTLFEKMDEFGIDNLIIDPLKAWEIGGARPRYNPSNPYINIEISEQDWLRSLALKNEIPGRNITPETKTITKTIEKFINQQKLEKTQPDIKTTKQATLPVVKAPSVPIIAPRSPVEAPKTPIMSETSRETIKPLEPREQDKNIPIGETRNTDLVDQYFKRIVDDIEYRKVKPDSPEGLEKIYMNIVDSFRVKNPGIPEKEFENAVKDAKSRARFYVQEIVDDTFKGTKYFGTDDIYTRKDKIIETEPLKSRDVKLAEEFGLKLKEPNEAGIQYLELDRYGNPMFSQEYKNKHDVKNKTPLDVWGSFLGSELKANKAELSLQSKTWGKQIEEMKNSKNPYSKGVAEALDKALTEKYAVKDSKTGIIKHNWHESWKLNSGLKKVKSLFLSKNEEGQLITEPFRNIMETGSKKDYNIIQKNIARAHAKTRAITEKAREARLNDMSSGKTKELPTGMRVKDPNQLIDVSEDLTPYDLLHSGLIRKEVRDNLIQRYNNIIFSGEIKPERRVETRKGADGDKILGTVDEMNKLFIGIKKLSEYIPESKNWKPGKKIELKNKGEPTFEEGVNDGIKIAAKIFKLNSSPGFVNFEKIKTSLLKDNPQKGSVGMVALLKTGLGALGVAGLTGLANMSSKSTYQAPKEEEINRIPDNKIGDVLKHMESSGGTDKGSADKGEVKWMYGLTNIAIKELKRVGLIKEIDVNNEEQVRDASIKYFKLMRKRNPALTDAEIYTNFYWTQGTPEENEVAIKKFNDFIS